MSLNPVRVPSMDQIGPFEIMTWFERIVKIHKIFFIKLNFL